MPERPMSLRLSPLIALALLAAAEARAEAEAALRSVGYETLCAEFDNVLVALSAPDIAGFTMTTTHPAYLAGLAQDDMDPDWTDCVFPPNADAHFTGPFSATLYEDERILLRGHRYARYWRPEEVPFHVGDRVWPGLHLTQLFVKVDGAPIETLVLYPSDGYWRPKPLPPVGRPETGYGASVLIGPVETAQRPLVRLSQVRFDPATLSYFIGFRLGGGAVVRLESVDGRAQRIGVTLDMPEGAAAFAMLSSMHVAPDNADIARASLRRAGAAFWTHAGIGDFRAGMAAEAAFGRDIPSQHNASAPDVAFGAFRVK
jgi:hypothetical protein